MEPIKISQKSLDDFKSRKALIPAPFDGKNLVDDDLRDYIFRGFYQADDMKNGESHLIGTEYVDNDDFYFEGIVDAKWELNSHLLRIELVACPSHSDFFSMRDDFFKYYESVFKEWENPDNEALVVHFKRESNVLLVSFYFECD